MYKKSVLSIAIIGVMGLSGCSSSSGSDDSSSGSDDSSSTIDGATVSGSAVKGVIYMGEVTAVELNATAGDVASLGSATTARDGSYSLSLNNYTGGPIKVSVTTTADTEMKCDSSKPTGCGPRIDGITDTNSVVDFGEWYKPGAGKVKMDSLVASAASGSSTVASITPFTHMAAARAFASSATLDATAVANANSEVSNLLGVDILNTTPVDITDLGAETTAEQRLYASFAAAIANLAVADTGGQLDLNGALNLLADAFAARGDILPIDGADTTAISFQDIVTETEAVLAAAGNISDTSGILSALQDTIDTTPVGGYINPEPGETSAIDPIYKVKALMVDLRTWLLAMNEDINTATTDSVFKEQVKLAGNAFKSLVDLNSPVEASKNLVNAAYKRAMDGKAEVDGDLLSTYDDSFESGTIEYANGVITIVDGLNNGYTGSMTVRIPADETEGKNFIFKIDSGTVSNGTTSLTITNGMTKVTVAKPYTVDYSVIGDVGFVPNVPEITNIAFNLSNIELVESLDTGDVTFKGTYASNFISFPVGAEGIYNDVFLPTTYSMVGSVTDGTDALNLTYAVNFTNLDTLTGLENLETFTETSDNWVDMDGGLTFASTLTDLPSATITITSDRTALDAADSTVTINFDNRKLVMSTEFTELTKNGDGTIGSELTVTNQDGAVLVMNIGGSTESSYSGTLSYNGKVYGNIEKTNDGLMKTTYTDGDFVIF